MTVKELRELLEALEDDTEIKLRTYHNGIGTVYLDIIDVDTAPAESCYLIHTEEEE